MCYTSVLLRTCIGPSLFVHSIKMWEGEGSLQFLAQDLSSFTFKCNGG